MAKGFGKETAIDELFRAEREEGGEKVASLEMRVSLKQWAKGGERVEAGGELGLERGER